MKIYFKLLALVCFLLVSFIYSYSKPFQHISFLKEGKCYMVLEYIQEQVNNDSLTVEFFKDNYKIKSLSSERVSEIFKQKPSEIISYFNIESNKEIYCYAKRFQDDYILFP